MLVEFPKILVTEVRTGTSKKTGNDWGRLSFFDGSETWSIFCPSDCLGVLRGLEVGRSYEGFRCVLRPAFNGGVELVPSL